ncbi:MAG: septum formation family protein [Microbacteriaceae bacterium]
MTTTSRILARAATVATVVAVSALLGGCSLINNFIGGTVEGEGDSTGIFSIGVGDCLNDAAAEGTVTSVPTVACTEPHDSEVYAAVMLEDGEFPGQDAISAQAETGCIAEFAAFMGIDYEDSLADVQFYYPTQETWATGDREILCLVYDTDGNGNAIQSTGSLADSGR